MNEQKTIPQLETLDILDDNLLFPVDTGVQSFNVTMAQLKAYIKAAVDSSISQKLVPSGSVSAFAGAVNKVPFGWFICDGQLLLRNDYPDLFAVIGVNFGYTSIHDFRVPDLRGMFIRGTANGSAYDPDRAGRGWLYVNGNSGDNVGSFQQDAIRNIVAQWYVTDETRTNAAASGAVSVGDTSGNSLQPGTTGRAWKAPHFYFNAANVVPVGSDNRPTNISMNYIIKI